MLIPIGIGLYRWTALGASLRFAWASLLAYFLLLALSMALATNYLVLPYTNAPEYVIYAMATLFGLGFAVCYALAVPPGISRKSIVGLETVALLGIGIELTFSAASTPVSQWAIPLQTVINTIIPLIYLYFLTQTSTSSLLTVPLFWISTGRLVSSLLSTLYDSLRVPMAESSRELLIQWLCFQFTVVILCNLVYALGFWKTRQYR
ncbi:hypothetical protein [Fibrella aquatica]|uniref:hypothetical protein n=1 Tax=Fibrella aquatica TaxID=3242487 RepID=UPI00351FC079